MKILSNDVEPNLPNSKKISLGGLGNFARSFSDFVSEKNHNYYGIIFKFSKLKKPRIIKIIRDSKGREYWKAYVPEIIRKEIISAVSILNSDDVYRSFINSMKELIQEIQPDIIFLNGFSDQAWSLMKAGHEIGVPVIMQHAGFLKTELDIYSDSFTSIGKKVFSDMEKEIGSLCDYEIFLNKWSMRKYSELIAPINSQKSIIIPLPFSVNYHCNNKKLKTDSLCHIGIIARWDRIKNQKAFLEVAIEAKKQGLLWVFHAITRIPKTNINKKFKDEFRRYIKVEKPRTFRELPSFYRQMDLMLLPSHFDVSPAVVLEAAVEGVGTLISPNTGWVDYYKENEAVEWIADFSNSKKIVERIKILLNKRFPKKLIKIMINRHNPESVFMAYLKLFKKIKK